MAKNRTICKSRYMTSLSTRRLATATQSVSKRKRPRKFLGAHVSIAGGLYKAVQRTQAIDGTALGMSVQPVGRLVPGELNEDVVERFQETYKQSKLVHALPHGSCLINLGNPDPVKRECFYQLFLNGLQRCKQLSLNLYTFHPGSTVGNCTRELSIGYIADAINRAHKEVDDVVCVIENTAGSGNAIGGRFEDIGAIIERVHDKSRVGTCLDTCHAFAAGYDWNTVESYEQTLSAFEKAIGFKYLRGVHLNDSKLPCGSRRDRHARIGEGQLAAEFWPRFMNDSRFDGLPIILETKNDLEGWKREINYLYSLVNEKASKRVGAGKSHVKATMPC